MAQDFIDVQFDKAVEIVQSLPKNGPIQTGYEEKLAMYSLYKQATVGNVQGPRPSMFDMLGRAKWDSWAKQKDLGAREAKWQYVETLMKVLRKYSDRTIARNLVQELESYGDPSSIVLSGTLSNAQTDSETSNSETDEDEVKADNEESNEPYQMENETDEVYDQRQHSPPVNEIRRPGSAISSQNRYRTPLAGSTINAPIPPHVLSPIGTPGMQVLPEHPTASAYAPSEPAAPPTAYPTTLAPQLTGGSQPTPSPRLPTASQGSLQQRPTLERAVESMQASLAALHERLESLETNLGLNERGPPGISRVSLPSSYDSLRRSSPKRGANSGPTWPIWDPSNMGAWSLVLQPLSRLETNLKAFAHFLAQSDERSPLLVVIRRLFLDLSFLFVFLIVFKSIWRRTSIRRREVYLALGGVWRAITGTHAPRIMAEKGV
ncbi:hypothetical protein PIIN_03902 [Serendipita indica DSM 11827]|uniref:ACB domain-containing protein n=1 Tax=Serendipita indica (strain DSM 11827) TaxID=1109443 RepID=G4TF80_SERID|nr:hypothetical protein PIIN_03902 [Serendipita indica DSM 11827]